MTRDMTIEDSGFYRRSRDIGAKQVRKMRERFDRVAPKYDPDAPKQPGWFFQKLWGLAEYADWHDWPPRKQWRRLLRWCDLRMGYGKEASVQPSPMVGVATTDCCQQEEDGSASWPEVVDR